MKRREECTRWVWTAVLICAALTAAGCGDEAAAPARKAPPVTVATPTRATINDYSILTGSTRAVESAEVMARVAGILESVEFEPGATVEKGQLLFTIEATRYRAARDVAQAAVRSAEAALLRGESDLARVEKASRSRAVSEMDVDRARADRDMAEAAVASAMAQLDNAELELSYTRVLAPVAGRVSRNLVDAGNLVGNNGATLLTKINQLQPILVYFHAPESMVLKYLANRESRTGGGNSALVARATDEGFPFEGVIDFIDNEVDRSTGTIELRVRLDNAGGNFFPGLFVRIKVPGVEFPEAVLVPEVAVGTDLGGKYVLTVDADNMVVRQSVTVGAPQAGGTVHIRQGLSGDERIVVNGLMFARPGMPVMPLTAEQFQAARQRAAAGK